ncbi:Uncharacterised protein [Actinobacillus pleuropneumoniae]|nr:Uncharacterised protein [Actinobacillus pleuropneumoniae]
MDHLTVHNETAFKDRRWFLNEGVICTKIYGGSGWLDISPTKEKTFVYRGFFHLKDNSLGT